MEDEGKQIHWWQVTLGVALSCLSAVFSGLTLGLMTLDVVQLKVMMDSTAAVRAARSSGEWVAPEELRKRTRRRRDVAKYAKRIYLVRKHGNLLLVSLLIYNVAANAGFSIIMGDILDGMIAFVVSTAVLTLFGEILPQAVFSRYPLVMCYWFVPLVIASEVIMLPIAWPIAALLDKMLGVDMGRIYTREQLAHLITHHATEAKVLDRAEEQIIGGGLKMAQKRAKDAMTPLEAAVGVKYSDVLDFATLKYLFATGYSRFAVFDSRGNIQGFLYMKDLALIQAEDKLKAHEVLALFSRTVFMVDARTPLLALLDFFKAGRSHVAIVRSSSDLGGNQLGIITLEDVLEEVIQDEIFDEFDLPPFSPIAKFPSPGVLATGPDLTFAAGEPVSLGSTLEKMHRMKAQLKATHDEDTMSTRLARLQLIYEQEVGATLTHDQARVIQRFLAFLQIETSEFGVTPDEVTDTIQRGEIARKAAGEVLVGYPAEGLFVVIKGSILNEATEEVLRPWTVLGSDPRRQGPSVLLPTGWLGGRPSGCLLLCIRSSSSVPLIPLIIDASDRVEPRHIHSSRGSSQSPSFSGPSEQLPVVRPSADRARTSNKMYFESEASR